MSKFSDLAKLIERTDRILNKKEDATIAVLNKSLSASFDNLELSLRRLYPDALADSSLIYRQANAAALLTQVKAAMQVINPAKALEYERVIAGLLTETQQAAITTGHEALNVFEKGVATFAPRIPIEVAATAAEQAVNNFEKHGKSFASIAATTITQGILQRWSIDETVRALRTSKDIAKSNAEMIVRTETLSAYNTAAVAFYEENGVDYVIRYATADDRTCIICAGRAGEITKLGSEHATLHPYCRCYFAPFKPAWLKAGVFDLGMLETFAEQVRSAHPKADKLDWRKVAPFEAKGTVRKVFWKPGANLAPIK